MLESQARPGAARAAALAHAAPPCNWACWHMPPAGLVSRTVSGGGWRARGRPAAAQLRSRPDPRPRAAGAHQPCRLYQGLILIQLNSGPRAAGAHPPAAARCGAAAPPAHGLGDARDDAGPVRQPGAPARPPARGRRRARSLGLAGHTGSPAPCRRRRRTDGPCSPRQLDGGSHVRPAGKSRARGRPPGPHGAPRAQTAGIMQRLRELAAEVHARYAGRHPAQPPQPGAEAAGGAGGKRRKRAPQPNDGPVQGCPFPVSICPCMYCPALFVWHSLCIVCPVISWGAAEAERAERRALPGWGARQQAAAAAGSTRNCWKDNNN